mgnify:CR=1 FL=1
MGFIRFILACGVVLCHTSAIYGYMPLSGDIAVQVFYIISGFYMAFILNDKYVGKGSIATFYSNRALKIYPIYWLVLLLIIAWSALMYYLGYPGVMRQYVDNWPLSFFTLAYLCLSNIWIMGLDWVFLVGLGNNGDMFFTSDFNSFNPKLYTFCFNSIAWTIGIELMFYMLAPFIVKRNIKLIILLLFISLTLRLVLAYFGLSDAPWNYMFFPTQLMFFMAGIISFRLYYRIRNVEIHRIVSMSIFIAYSLFLLFYYNLFPNSYIQEVLLFSFTALIIPVVFKLSMKSKIDRYLGDLSYPIYISQSLIIMVTAPKVFPKIFGWGFTALCLCIFFAVVVHHFITRPIERMRLEKIGKMQKAKSQSNQKYKESVFTG